MAKKTIEEKFSKASAYDSKHINNLSTKRVPSALLRAVEDGCSYETLVKLAKGYPICKYQTQITVHGIFEKPQTRSAGGGYVNLMYNKNKSLGIRWTAIDHDKKLKLFEYIYSIDKEWHEYEDSTAFLLRKIKRVENKEEYEALMSKWQKEAERIDTSLFIGRVNVCGLKDERWGLVYVQMDLNVKCFPEENMSKIVENVTGKTIADAMVVIQEKRDRWAAKDREWKAKLEENERRREEAKRVCEEMMNEWMESNPIPSGYAIKENHTFKDGDMEVCQAVSQHDDTFSFEWKYMVYYKSFGKLCKAVCDANGKRLGKGVAVLNPCKRVSIVKK